jgi:tripartite-type tricarboxylate transporter receptor subunit TctC
MSQEERAMLISARALACVASILLILPSAAIAQSWPARPITLICPFGAGGAPDIIARFVAQELGDKLGQRVVVENRTGASGNIGAAAVAKSAPDGYTILLGTPSPIVINKLIEGTKQSFDPDTELTPIVVIGASASIMVTSPKSSVNTVQDLIAAAKAKPGTLNAGVPGLGTSSHLAMELFMRLTDTKLAAVPYRGTPPLADLVSGQLDVAITPTIAYISLINEGQLRPLAVTSPERSGLAPSVPTLDELGLKGYEATTWYILMAATGTPPAIVDRINDIVNAYLKAENGQKMLKQFDVAAGGGTPKAAKDYVTSEVDKWRPIVKAANFKMQ